MLYLFCKFLVKDLDVSICASFFLGPITFKPCLSKRSATPSLNGFSGPMTAVVQPVFLAKDSTISGLLISPTWKVEQEEMIPGLLFDPRQNRSCGLLDLEIERHIACSRAPDPTTNIFSLFIFKAGLSVRIKPAFFKTT